MKTLIRFACAAVALFVVATNCTAQEPAELGPPIIHALEFSPDGKTLAAATGGESSGGGPLVLWSVEEGKKEWRRRELAKETAGCSCVAFSKDGKRLAYGDWKDKAVVVDVETGEVVRSIEHSQPVAGVAFAPDGGGLATACHNRYAYLWDVETGEEIRRFEGHEDKVSSVDVSPDGTLLLSASEDRSVRLWRLDDGTLVYTSPPRGGHAAEFSASGVIFVCSGGDGYTRVRETESRKLIFFPRTFARAACLSPDERWLATASGTAADVYKMDIRQPAGDELRRIDELIDVFYGDDYAAREEASAELARFGLVAEQRLAEAVKSKDAEVRIRCRQLLQQARSPEEPAHRLEGLAGRVQCLCFSPDGKFIAVGSRGGDVKVWSLPDFKEITHLQPPGEDENAAPAADREDD